MADQGKWFKLWVTSIDDPELENLELDDWARWAKLGAYIKSHGKDGRIRFSHPYRKLLNMFRVHEIETAKQVLNRFPNVHVGERRNTVSTETNETVSLEIEYTNWLKYQGDFSSDRVRRFRDKKRHHETVQEEKRREKEEKRNPPVVPQGTASKITEWFEKTWQAYPKERRVGKKAALRSYQRIVKSHEDALRVARALDNYLKSQTVKDGFIKNASTFFANTEDYTDERRDSQGTFSEMAPQRSAPAIPGNGINPTVKQVVAGLGNSMPSANSKDRI